MAKCVCGSHRFRISRDQTRDYVKCASCGELYIIYASDWDFSCTGCLKRLPKAIPYRRRELVRCGCDADQFRVIEYTEHLSKRISASPRRIEKRRPLPPTVKQTLFEKCRGICAGCLDSFRQPGNMEIDHIIPSHKGGSNSPDNLQLLCRSCNTQKGTGTMDELILKLKRAGIR